VNWGRRRCRGKWEFLVLSGSIMLGLQRTWLLVVVCIMSASGTVTVCVEFAHMSFVL
jgi:hypothetical protein